MGDTFPGGNCPLVLATLCASFMHLGASMPCKQEQLPTTAWLTVTHRVMECNLKIETVT